MNVVPKESQNITREKLKRFLPKGSSVQVTDEILEMISNMENDTGLPQYALEEDVMSYMHLIGKGIGIAELVNAIKYCNLKRNRTNKEAWAITFPSKYDEMIKADRVVDSFVSMYNSSKIVVAIDKEMMVPVYIQYSSYFHAAVKKQFELMNGVDSNGNEVGGMVQHLSSKVLMEMLKMPEDKSIEIRIGASDSLLAAQNELSSSISSLVSQQAEMFARGMSPDEIQKVHKIKLLDESIIDAELE